MKYTFAAIAICLAVPGTLLAGSQKLPFTPFRTADSAPFHAVRPLASDISVTPLSAATGIELVGANLNTGALVPGVYSFNATQTTAWNKLLGDVDFIGGGVYVNGKYYAQTFDYDMSYNLTVSKWMCYDAETWKLESSVDCPLNDWTYVAADRTFDPSTGRTYALNYDRTIAVIQLSVTDLATGANTLVGSFPENVTMICLAADGKGGLYAIDTKANLYSVDPMTAATALIGNTKIFDEYETGYPQSAAIDPLTGTLYWAEFHTEGWTPAGALYSINVANAETVKVMDFPAKAEFTGLFVPDQGIAAAPSAPQSLAWNAAATGSTQIRFEFDAPTTANDGSTLPSLEMLTLEVIIDNETYDLIDGVKAGAHIVTDYYDVARGAHTVKVRAENAAGTGKNASAYFFSGWDVPAAPASIELTCQGSQAQLSWAAPTTGAEGGAVRAPFTYNVMRMPGAVKVATGLTTTTFTETIAQPARYTYTVTASSVDGEGPAAESNSLVIGNFTVPFLQTFDTENDASVFTVIDANNDERTWAWNADDRCMRYSYAVLNAANDWLITPGITLDAAKSYEFSFEMRKYLNGYNEKLEVYYGTKPSTIGMKKVASVTVPSTESNAYAITLPALAEGSHWFAIRIVSPANQMFVYIDNVKVTEAGLVGVPASPEAFSAKASGNGYLDAEITLTAPKTTLNGVSLSTIDRIDIFRGTSDVAVHSFTNPAPGAALSWTDAALRQGAYTYRAVAVNASGASAAVTADMYAGIDVPAPATDVVMTIDADHIPTVSWKAPAAGVNGGRMDGIVTYDVVRVANSQEMPVATSISETSFTDQSYAVTEQAHLYYVVIAKTSAGQSAQAMSEGTIVGDPYIAPFHESFSGMSMDTNPWFTTLLASNSGGWAIKAMEYYSDGTARPHDSDGGVAVFDGYHTYAGDARLTSPRIAIDHLSKPVLSFYMYHYRGSSWSGEVGPQYVNTALQIEIARDGGAIEEIPGARFNMYAEKNGWQLHEVDLRPYTDSKFVNVTFKGITGYTENLTIDNITVGATYTKNVEVAAFSGPSSVQVGDVTTFNGSVFNSGSAEANTITAGLYCNGTKVTGRSIRSIAPGASSDVTFDVTVPDNIGDRAVWQMRLTMNGDENSLDNLSPELYTEVSGNVGVESAEITGLTVAGAEGGIIFAGAAEGLSVYTPSGVEVAQTASAEGFIELPAGLYIASSGNAVIKVIVK